MQYRALGQTDMKVSQLGFGASSLGAEFRRIDLNEAIRSVHTALDLGMNLIDTSAYYGRGLSEALLGQALNDVPRDKYYLCSKLGRYTPEHFDFSARRVAESVDVSLQRMKTDHVDIMLCHDIEFVDMQMIIDETLPALRKQVEAGKVRYIGVSGYPMKMFRYVLDRTDLNVILSYNHYTMQNTMLADMVPYLKEKNVGIMNAAPFSARLLTGTKLPDWHKATPKIRQIAEAAAECAREGGSDIAKLALQFSIDHPDFATCIVGSANPNNVQKWVDWANEPIDRELMNRVLEILKPIHNWFYTEGRPENNDEPINVVE